MKINKLKSTLSNSQNKKLASRYTTFQDLINELKKKKITPSVASTINKGIDEINALSATDKQAPKVIQSVSFDILKLLEKELNIVSKGHYRGKWMALGMSAFGIPLGVAFGASLQNMAFIGIGLPIGLVIGIAIGTAKDKKAKDEGRQLDFEI